MSSEAVLVELRALSDPRAVKGMARFGISSNNTLGISIPRLRGLARKVGKHHSIAQQLWESGIHEARILAAMVDEPELVTEKQMESWVKDFDSWDVCDGVCSMFDQTPYAYEKAVEWSSRKEEYVKRAAFALMAELAVHDKKADDDKFAQFMPFIKKEATDDRNFVKKAVNWALRQIGKRNLGLNSLAVKTAKEIRKIDSRSAKWIAADALRELTDHKTLDRMWAKKKP